MDFVIPDYVYSLILIAALLWASHYTPLEWLVAKVHPTVPYVIGSSCILVGFALWQLSEGNIRTILGLIGMYAVGGAMVWGLYIFDYFASDARKERLNGNDKKQ